MGLGARLNQARQSKQDVVYEVASEHKSRQSSARYSHESFNKRLKQMRSNNSLNRSSASPDKKSKKWIGTPPRNLSPSSRSNF